jgi:hypothetical protein
MRLFPLVIVFLALSVLRVHAADTDKDNRDKLAEPPEPVKHYKAPLPAAAVDTKEGAIPEPEVTITTKGETLHEEYRIGGQLYMIKVIPKNGRAYYLIDNEGQGQFMRNDFQPSISPPQWVIKRF